MKWKTIRVRERNITVHVTYFTTINTWQWNTTRSFLIREACIHTHPHGSTRFDPVPRGVFTRSDLKLRNKNGMFANHTFGDLTVETVKKGLITRFLCISCNIVENGTSNEFDFHPQAWTKWNWYIYFITCSGLHCILGPIFSVLVLNSLAQIPRIYIIA